MSLAEKGQYPYLDDWQFWRVCIMTQVREFEIDLLKGDEEHAIKELIDIITVGIDALRLKGFDFWHALYARLTENAAKRVETRGQTFYVEKLLKEERTLLELGGSLTSLSTQEINSRISRKACAPDCGMCNELSVVDDGAENCGACRRNKAAGLDVPHGLNSCAQD